MDRLTRIAEWGWHNSNKWNSTFTLITLDPPILNVKVSPKHHDEVWTWNAERECWLDIPSNEQCNEPFMKALNETLEYFISVSKELETILLGEES